MVLKEEIIQKIRTSGEVKVKMQAAFGYISESTLYTRLKQNDKSLTEYSILLLLSKEFDTTIEDLLEPDSETANVC